MAAGFSECLAMLATAEAAYSAATRARRAE